MIKKRIFYFLLIIHFNCKNDNPRPPKLYKSGNFTDYSVKRNIDFNNEQDTEIFNFINKSKKKFTRSDYGFWYHNEIKKNKSKYKPKFGDKIFYTFECMTLNGEKQFNFNAKQQIYRMEQQDIISGLREGFKLMSEGDITTFIFPSYLAYGLYGDSEKKIKPNTTLVYEVNVQKILKNNL